MLPVAVERAAVLGGSDVIADALHGAGVSVVERKAEPVDVVVAPPRATAAAARRDAPLVVITGRARRRPLRRAGYRVTHLLCLDGATTPRLVVPLGATRALRYAMTRWSRPHQRWRRLRNRLAVRLLRLGIGLRRETLTVAARSPGPPFVIVPAAGYGCRADQWLLDFRSGQSEMRGVVHLFEPGRTTPTWVLKFARVAGQDRYFDDETRGFEAVERAGEPTVTHAPRRVGLTNVDGVTVSVETAALDTPLPSLLATRRGRARKLQLVDEIASWIVAVGESTATAPASIEIERGLLETYVLPHWLDVGAPADLVGALPPVPGVLIHGDLSPDNIVASGDDFTVVDWEDVRAPGLPLWDLVTFLGDALPAIDAPAEDAMAARARLFRGDAPSSARLFDWVRQGAASLSIPADAIGPLVTLCWCYHGARAWIFQGRDDFRGEPMARFAHTWLTDHRLGPHWKPPA